MMVKKTLVTSVVIVFLALLALPLRSFSVTSTYNVQKYGAIGDSSAINTKFIQSAIDDCAKAGGGTVYFPAGKYISGTLFLKSNITLHLDAGAVLIGSGVLNDYPVTVSGIRSFTDNYTDKSLIYGEGLEHIGIIGDGIMDGNGTSFKGEYKVRPYMIRIINCKDVLVRDINLINSPMWVQHYLACENVIIDGVNVDSRRDFVNNDGIDIDGCKNVRISNCDFKSGDDGVVLKSTLNQPCENITVTNCIISSNCNGFKLGTETNGGFENITFSNSVIYDTKLGGISLELVDGGNLDRVTVTNISMNNVGAALFIRLGNRARPFIEKMEKPGIGKLSNVMISNIQASNVGNIGCSITGLPGFPVKNISLNHIRLSFQGGGTKEFVNREIPELPEKYPEFRMFGMLPAYGFYCRHAENVTFNDIESDYTETDERPAFVCDDICGLELCRIKAKSAGNEPLIKCMNVSNLFVHSNKAPLGIQTFLDIAGSQSKHITLSGNDLNGAKNPVTYDSGIELNGDFKYVK